MLQVLDAAAAAAAGDSGARFVCDDVDDCQLHNAAYMTYR
jgi:hypothetical protein